MSFRVRVLALLLTVAGTAAGQSGGLTISPTTLPPGTVGVPYSQPLSASGGTPPYTWTVPAGSAQPPLGLTLSPSGTLSGTPTSAGTFSFTVVVVDSTQDVFDQARITLTINALPPFAITTTSPLPSGTVGKPYFLPLQHTGGVGPFTWSLIRGELPPPLTISAAGILSGLPTTAGTFSFTVEVHDSQQNAASGAFTLTIDPPPLVITTTSPLATGQVGGNYSQTLTGEGGTPPYTWSPTTQPLPPGIELSPTGILSGSPTSAGEFTFVVLLTDGAKATARKTFVLTVVLPRLAITTASPLPPGIVGTAYSATLQATGGRAPYRWSVSGGTLPGGLSLSAAGVISGTPTSSGAFNLTVEVTDAADNTVSKTFALAVTAPPLSIVTTSPLADATLGTAYSVTLGVTGGTSPYTWSIVFGSPPPGVTMTPAGLISGTPTAGGPFGFTVRVQDDAGATTARHFDLLVSVPPLPPASIQGPAAVVGPAQQPRLEINLASAYPVPITGQAVLTFTPDAVVPADDPALQFSSGGRTASFTIPANQTQAVFSVPNLAIQTGSVAGTIQVSARFSAGDQDLTPSPAPSILSRIDRIAPAISAVRVVRTATGFNVEVTGISTPRQVTQAVFRFTPSGQGNLQTTEVTVNVTDAFLQWYQSEASRPFGSAFTYTQPFTVQGDTAALASVSVALTNAQGTSQPATANF